MEGQKSWHSRIPTPEEYKLAILELEELKWENISVKSY
jgi:hypothetical protein